MSEQADTHLTALSELLVDLETACSLCGKHAADGNFAAAEGCRQTARSVLNRIDDHLTYFRGLVKEE